MGNSPKTSSHLTRWILRLQQFDFQVHHRKGCLNQGPDALSRAPGSVKEEDAPCLVVTPAKHSSDIPHSLAEMAQAQNSDKTISRLKAEPKTRKVKDQQITFEEHQGVLYR